MAQPAKDGYEAAPLLDHAEAGVQTPDWQPEQPAPRTWHGSLFACCGPQCDVLGWTTCLVSLCRALCSIRVPQCCVGCTRTGSMRFWHAATWA
jgi:hypothetical protein